MVKRPTVAAVRRELKALGVRDERLREGTDAALALAMAHRVDDPAVSAAAAASCGKVLGEAMVRLRLAAPAAHKRDFLDDLNARRAARRTGVAG